MIFSKGESYCMYACVYLLKIAFLKRVVKGER